MSSSETRCCTLAGMSQESVTPTIQPASSIYAIIPSTVRSRLPSLVAIRRSVRSTLTSNHLRARSMPDLRLQHDTLLRDTLANNALTISSASTSPIRPSTPEDTISDEDTRFSNSTQGRVSTKIEENESGVDWDTAELGVRLWLNAYARIKQGGQVDGDAIRASHLDATRYMIRALPTHLTPLEKELLNETISKEVSNPPRSKRIAKYEPRHNLLRTVTAQMVCMTITLVFFIIPVLMTLLNQALRFERDHRVSEQIIQGAKVLVQNLISTGFEFGDSVSRFTESRFGAPCYEVFVSLVQSVLAGVNDGLIKSSNGNVQLLEYGLEKSSDR